MRKSGRPPVLDGKKRLQIVAIMSVGCSQAVAAQYVGCAPATISNTAERDPVFGAEIEKAKSNSELSLVKNIRNAANKAQYWRAAAWALERAFPEKYALRDPNLLTPEQITDALAKFTEIILHDVPARYRTSILRKLNIVARELGIDLKPENDDDSH